MNTAYVALGSNIGDRTGYLQKALREMSQEQTIELFSISSIYETEPVGLEAQPYFLNMAVALKTNDSADFLLAKLQSIELRLDRVRNKEQNGPRTMDLDILLFNDENMEKNRLCIPHPRMHERAFVLVPMSEIAPHQVVPTYNQTIKHILDSKPEGFRKGVRVWKRQGQAEEFGLFEN
ncbi:2-amino-4-hydroxy-6-hydroxymethyldihydropteridine diphosphokinase [Salicibibacter halophilus]|uniref:2-amino-4-hydroxy-6-hydroxymethyldihydropteridine diphosphokinase n=1 Tax=Salicibibacter halophilus TaxID=2502791 RepID=A0A514LI60_9BACI|nr:2-amino-4-hydroxy-6-hydroxymethyldihydropteridine diphosphokinase [Salicibibacter halophilus]QDI91534.1 2-amino-4-hydroxy-6-hydroxymethyldihydropteridine diphosphokinase [Salicibibacter halophilus]